MSSTAAACGRARSAAWSALELPVLAMEHMYLLTEPMPEVEAFNKATGREMIGVLDFKGEIYTRQERNGILLGTYEKACKPWSPVNTPWDFGHELLPPDLDRIAPSLEVGFRHFPGIEKAGIKQIINGPFTFAPDGNPLVGPVQGLTNFWVACGVMAGFSQGGGVGLALSNWMVNGDPGFDVWGMDVARFGEWATPALHQRQGARELFAPLLDPLPQRGAAGRRGRRRPRRSTTRWWRRTPSWATRWGLETPLWFAPKGTEPKDIVSFHRSNDFEHVGNEVRAMRERVGVTEIANFAKYEVSGPGAEDFLNRLMTNRMPKTGRIVLTPMLNEFGKLIGDFTIAKTGDERFMIWGSSAAQKYHMRWFEKHLPKDGSVRIHRFDQTLVGLSIAGPKAQALLAEAGRRRRVDQGLPLHGFPRDGGRRRALHGQPHHLYRRSRLRDLDGAGLPAAGLHGDQGGRRGVRHRRFRHARAAVDAAGEELPDLVPRAPADLRAVRRRAWTASSSWRRTISSAARRPPRSEADGRSCAASR